MHRAEAFVSSVQLVSVVQLTPVHGFGGGLLQVAGNAGHAGHELQLAHDRHDDTSVRSRSAFPASTARSA